MTLDYKVLWFEDTPTWYEAILPDISDFLTENGFTLVPNRQESGSELEKIIEDDDYDLILIDYNLLDNEKGDILIQKIRDLKVYTDIVFYSQHGEKIVRDVAKEKGLDGVFCASRDQDEFLEKVFKVITTTIKKVVDLNNMRGLVMAYTGELDIKMAEVIIQLLQNFSSQYADKHKETIKKKFIESLEDRIKSMKKLDTQNDSDKLVKKIESYHKWRAVLRLCSENEELKEFEPILSDYETAIIVKRNILAHICEEIDENGNKILRSTLPGHEEYTFNEAEAIQIRNDLRKYSEIFTKILEKFQ